MKFLSTLSLAVLLSSLALAAKPAAALTPGSYTATLKQLACEGCPSWIVQHMKEIPGIADASVDGDKRVLTFSVKPGAKLKVETIQKKLNAAAEQMGMGADYALKDVKPVAAR